MSRLHPCFGAALLLVPVEALAAPDVVPIARMACGTLDAQSVEYRIPLSRLAEALLSESGVSPLAVVHSPQPGDYTRKLLDAAISPPVDIKSDAGKAAYKAAGEYRYTLANRLVATAAGDTTVAGLRLESDLDAAQRDPGGDWLFRDETKVRLFCSPESAAEEPDPSKLMIGLARNLEALTATGEERRKAAGASIALKSISVAQDDGSRRTDRSLSIDGTLGLRFSTPDAVWSSFAFATYTLSRERTSPAPAPALPAGARRDDNDIDVLSLGVVRAAELGEVVTVAGDASYITDFVKNSERVRARLAMSPILEPTNFKICGVGYAAHHEVMGLKFRTICDVTAELELSHVLDKGRADFGANDEFVLAGLRGGIAAYPPVFGQEGIIAKVDVRYLAAIGGTAPRIKRVEAGLAYRWWVSDGFALDFGGSYHNGNEVNSFAKEESFELSFGILF